MNQYESQAMLEELCRSGFAPAETEEEADVVILNSCTVTGGKRSKMRKLLHRARRKNPQALLVLTGCMPQAFPEEAAKLPEPDLVLGTSNRKELVPSVLKALENRRREVKIRPYTGKDSFESLQIHSFQERTRAFLKIQDGCNRFCSYCIIPYSRGRVRSKPLEELTPGGPDSGGVRLPGNCSHRNQPVPATDRIADWGFGTRWKRSAACRRWSGCA